MMNVWFRAKDGKSLYPLDNCLLIGEDVNRKSGRWCLELMGQRGGLLATYPDEPTAMKVLDEVVRRMQKYSEVPLEFHSDGQYHVRFLQRECTRIIDLRDVEKAVLGEGSGDDE